MTEIVRLCDNEQNSYSVLFLFRGLLLLLDAIVLPLLAELALWLRRHCNFLVIPHLEARPELSLSVETGGLRDARDVLVLGLSLAGNKKVSRLLYICILLLFSFRDGNNK